MRIAWFALISVFLASACGPVFAVEVPNGTVRAKAVQYLQENPQLQNIFIWPGKIRFYEVIGSDEQLVSKVVQGFNVSLEGQAVMGAYPRSPSISINIYEGDVDRAISDFVEHSGLPAQWKESMVTRDPGAAACAFSLSTSRETWAAGGFLFVDKKRLGNDEAVESCLSAGLDYINGFPAPAHLQFEDFPVEGVRRAIVRAALDCSKSGKVERTGDGFSPLPSMACVVDQLANLED